MPSHLRMGALNKETNKYEYAKIAIKKNKYMCPECKRDVILKKGEIKAHHFAHYRTENPCTYYDRPSESQIHKDAKMLMKTLLENKRHLCFNRTCKKCKIIQKITVDSYTDNTKIELEYRFQYNNKLQIADVAYLDDGLKYIFEICYRHKTLSEKRPEPWVEIDAESFINTANDEISEIQCIRNEICKDCKIQEEVAEKIRCEREEEERKNQEELRLARIKREEEWEKGRPERERLQKLKREEEQCRQLEIAKKIKLARIKLDEEWEKARPERERLQKLREEEDFREREIDNLRQRELERERADELVRRVKKQRLIEDNWRTAKNSVEKCNKCKEKRCKTCGDQILKAYNKIIAR